MIAEYKASSVRDENGKWLNSQVFRQDAIRFLKTGGFKNNGYYCNEPVNSPGYINYWDEQLRRCKEGYEVEGHKITQHHYQYLNFSPIQVAIKEGSGNVSSKITTLPDFWDGDYDYFWSLEIAKNGMLNSISLASSKEEKEECRNLTGDERKNSNITILERLKLRVKPHTDYLEGGNHMVIGKSRRKGYSFKNASVCVNTYNTTRKSFTTIGAFDKKYLYPKGTMGMASDYLSFLSKHTAWGKAREFVDKQEHKRASYEEVINGVRTESGYMSEIMAVTFKDNPSAARGKDPLYVLLEEAGAFPNLKESHAATMLGLTAGRYMTGQILIFGTGGDMEVGTKDFAEMFYSPIEFGCMPFVNIWDKNADNSYCGFFHPIYLNFEGFYDEQGNSDIDGAIAHELAFREKLVKNSTSSFALQSRMQECPLSPSEAFLTVSSNDFPVVELRARYNKVVANQLHIKLGTPVYLERTKRDIEVAGVKKTINIVKAVPDLDNLVNPLWDYKTKTKELKGGVVIYEGPVANPPKGLYKIGFDPYRQVSSTETYPSLGAIYVYKGFCRGGYLHNQIVAQYVGRPYDPDDVNRIAEMLAELYNAEIMHENEVTHVKAYFQKRKKLHLLAFQPNRVITANIKDSEVNRVYGIHMTEKLKDAGEKYIKQWLLEIRDYDSEGNPIYNLDTINDPGLLEELILYNRKGNFDRVMSFMMLMFQIEEEGEQKVYELEQKNSTAQDLLKSMRSQFKNNRHVLN